MNILLIEDDEFLSRNIEKILEKNIILNRFKAINNFDSFLNELDIINSYDIVIIDIFLKWSRKNWIDILSIIRKKNKEIPLIIISSCNCLDMISNCFDLWASDYIIKPFRLKEFEIRVFKWFKDYFYSIRYFDKNILGYYDLVFNLKENKFYFNNNEIKLSKQNKYLLSIFISYSEKFITKKFLIDKIWWDLDNNEKRNIRVSILRLKKDLEKVWIQNWIHTVRWEWYILKK